MSFTQGSFTTEPSNSFKVAVGCSIPQCTIGQNVEVKSYSNMSSYISHQNTDKDKSLTGMVKIRANADLSAVGGKGLPVIMAELMNACASSSSDLLGILCNRRSLSTDLL